MENLRVVSKGRHIDQYNTGDCTYLPLFEVRRDFNPEEKDKFPYSQEVLANGVLITSFNFHEHADLFLQALELKQIGESLEYIKKSLLKTYLKND